MKDENKIKREKRIRRKIRIKAKVRGFAAKPRLNVFRSNKHIFLQLIDDESGKTLVSASDVRIKQPKSGKKNKAATKTEAAFLAGKSLAEMALKKKIKQAVFDRGGYVYHGRIKSAAEGARKGGLAF